MIEQLPVPHSELGELLSARMPGDGTGREGGGPRKGAFTGKGGGREGEAEQTELFLFR